MLNKIESILNWEHHFEVLYKKWDIKHKSQQFTDTYWLYFPFTEKYFFECNPSFYCEYESISDMGRYPIVMLRDGFLGIADFFINNPTPPSFFTSIIMIDEKFSNLIPKVWTEYFCTFSIQPRKIQTNSKSELIFYGYGVEENFLKKSPKEIASELYEMSKAFDKVTALVPNKYSVLARKQNLTASKDVEFFKELYQAFGFDFKFYDDIKEFCDLYKGNDFSFYNLDQDKVFIADNFIDHQFYSMGGQKLIAKNDQVDIVSQEKTLDFNLSLNHKIVIKDFLYKANDCIFPKIFIDYRLSGVSYSDVFHLFRNKNIIDIFKDNY